MKVSRSAVSPRDALIAKIVQFCDWAEGARGQHILPCKDEESVCGHMARTELIMLRQDLNALFDGWPRDIFVIDIRHHRFALDACCEVADVLRKVEESRGLTEKSLQDRLILVDSSNPDSPEYRALVKKEQQALEEALLKCQPIPVNPLASALKEVGL